MYALLLILSISTIAGAWFFQIFMELPPCPLCLQQRWPYYIGIPIIFVGLLFAYKKSFIVGCIFILVAIIMLVGSILSFYHVGIELQWWKGPTGCSGGNSYWSSGNTLPDLKNLSPIARCDEIAWSLFGISLAGYNFLILISMVFISLYGFIIYCKHDN